MFFLLTYMATSKIYTLSLHDALPIWVDQSQPRIFGFCRMRFDDMGANRVIAVEGGLHQVPWFGFLARHGQFMVRWRTAAICRISSARSANSSGRIDWMPSERAFSGS